MKKSSQVYIYSQVYSLHVLYIVSSLIAYFFWFNNFEFIISFCVLDAALGDESFSEKWLSTDQGTPFICPCCRISQPQLEGQLQTSLLSHHLGTISLRTQNARTGTTPKSLCSCVLSNLQWHIQLHVLVLLKPYRQFMSNVMLRIFCVVEYKMCMHKLDACKHLCFHFLCFIWWVFIAICVTSKYVIHLKLFFLNFSGFKLLSTYPCFVCK